MDRAELFAQIAELYGAEPEYLWSSAPNYAVFRHSENRKWFGIVMDVPATRLGLEGDGAIDILNVKVDPEDALVLRLADGILPAYHMNKKNWVSVVLEGNIPDDMLLGLLEMSFGLTS